MSLGAGGVPPGTPVSPLGGRRVDVQVLGRLGWRTNHSVKTDAAGKAETQDAAVAQPRACARASRASRACCRRAPASLQVGVRPRRTAAASVAGKRVRVTGTVRPKKATAILTLKRRTPGGRLVRVSRRAGEAARRRTCSTNLRLTRPAAYRLRLSVAADARNLSARSQVVEFRVG